MKALKIQTVVRTTVYTVNNSIFFFLYLFIISADLFYCSLILFYSLQLYFSCYCNNINVLFLPLLVFIMHGNIACKNNVI